MKIYISADMEGISGIVDPSFIQPGSSNYPVGCQWMMHDVNAVVEAAFEEGASEVVVADSHSVATNLRLDALHPKARLITGYPRDLYMLTGLDSSFDAAFFVGYHARHGTSGVLSHSYSFKNMYLNGRLVGEFGFNAMFAGLMGVPVCLVTGDDRTAEEAKEVVPDVTAAVVKKAISRTSALCLPLEEAKSVLRSKTKEALRKLRSVKPVQVDRPLELRVEFFHTGEAEIASRVPGAEYQPGSTEVTYVTQDPVEMYRAMEAMAACARKAVFF